MGVAVDRPDRKTQDNLRLRCNVRPADQRDYLLYVYGVVFPQAIGISQQFLITLITNILQFFAVGASVIFQHKMKRRVNLLVTTDMIVFAFIVIGGIGTKPLNTASQYVIVVIS
jgi:hypothetical protein